MGQLTEHLEYLVSGSDNLLALLDKDFVYLTVNDTYLNTFGKTKESCIGYSIDKVLGKKFFEKNIKPNANYTRPWKNEIYNKNWTDSSFIDPRYLEITYLPYFGQNKEVKGFIVNGRDITRRKKAEKALKEIEGIYITLFSNLSDPLIIFDEETNLVLDCNQAAMQKYGYSLKEFRKLIRYNLHPPEELKKINRKIYDLENSNPQYFTHINKKKKRFCVEVHTARTTYNGRKAYISMIKDVSRNRFLEDEIKEARIKAEEGEKLKSAFLANLSHEIRTPLNSIMGFSNLLNDVENIENREEFISIINRSGEQLLKVIDDVIQVSKIEAGLVQIKDEEFNVNSLINDVLHIFKLNEKLRSKKLKFITKYGLPYARSKTRGDWFLLRQVLTNIIENAIKFTNKGNIEIGYEIVNDKDKPVFEFYIKDSGIGIHPDKQKIIFERFRQADMSSSRLNSGTGLGLSISKSIINLLNGLIWVESTPSKGSTFFFTIPYKII